MARNNIKNKIKDISQNPGVYIFKDKSGRVLYVGKAAVLRERVRSYFSGTDARGQIPSLMKKAKYLETIETDSVLEAVILEANLIKDLKPPYNIKDKDDKSFSYIILTKEEFPKFFIVRETDLREAKKTKHGNKKIHYVKTFGPYTSKRQIEMALKILRKIFPFHLNDKKTEKGCLDFQIGLCPGPYAKAISREDYLQNIRSIKMILEGKKGGLIKKMEKEMRESAKKEDFEKAKILRDKIFSLKHIRDMALILNDMQHDTRDKEKNIDYREIRIEAYDVSDISGKYAVGTMAVFKGNAAEKSQYRKFKIRTIEGANDIGMMKEILTRRFKNNWPLPDLVLLDGGLGHLNMGTKVLREFSLNIPIAAVAKGPERKNQEIRIINNKLSFLELKHVLGDKKLIKIIMDEVHRFAITYHKKLRKKGFLE